MNQTIPHWLEKQFELNPDRPAIEFENGEVLTFAELRKESRQAAAGMKELGVKPGDHIALLVTNSRQAPIFIHAISYIGAVGVMLNTRLTPAELAYQLDDAEVTFLFAEECLYQQGKEAIRTTSLTKRDFHILEDCPRLHEESELKSTLHLETPFTMMYTSGTTGKPKAVIHSYGNHWFSAISSALNLGLSSHDKWLLCLPVFHVGGFSILMKNVIYGMPISLFASFDEDKVNQQILHNQVTIVSVVTVMLQRLLDNLDERLYPSAFRCMLLGGGPAPKPLLEEAHYKSIPVFQTYGMTETSSQISTLSPGDAFRKVGSAGKALHTADLIVEAEQPGEVGEILVSGPMVSDGYYKRQERQSPWFRTGDLGYLDEEGFLYIVDRVKDVIISGGENVYPAEVESVLAGIRGVKEAGVTGVQDNQWGEVPVAFLVMEPEAEADVKELYKYCTLHLAKFKIPHAFHVIKELPRNASNKILRRKLPDTLGDGE